MVRVISIVTAILQVVTIIVAITPFALSIVEYNDNEFVDGINVK